MPAISLLAKTYTYTNGPANDADQVELDLANAYSNFSTIQTDYNQLVTGAYSIAGLKTFTSGIATNTIAEVTPAAGVTVDGLLIKDGGLPDYQYIVENYIKGLPPSYTSAATITLPDGLIVADSTNAHYLSTVGAQVVSLAASGANGLDTGSEASNTWYYLYLIGSSTDPATYPTKGLFSVTNEAVSGTVTLPANYDIKRQLPLAVRNDGSSDIIPFYCPVLGEVKYQTKVTHNTGTIQVGDNNILSAGTATTATSVSAASFIPPISRYGLFNHLGTGSLGTSLAEAGSGVVVNALRADASSFQMTQIWSKTNTSQAVEYYRLGGSGSIYLDAIGYKVTELVY
jgi:hypothetical protein